MGVDSDGKAGTSSALDGFFEFRSGVEVYVGCNGSEKTLEPVAVFFL